MGNQLVATQPQQSSAPRAFTAGQIDLIKRTVANDCSPAEFDLFVTVAQRTGLDPLRKQISALVFSKGNADKRRMAIVTTIDGLRTIAARSGRYRPDDEEPRYEVDATLKGPANPEGIVKAVVSIFIEDVRRPDSWRKVIGVAYWAEFAPLTEQVEGGWKWIETGDSWPDGKPKKRKVPKVDGAVPYEVLDTSGNWAKMPRLMIAKCAEAQALRKAFPEDTSGLYEAAELDRVQVTDVTPSELIDRLQTEDRLTRLGMANTIMLQLSPTSPIEPVKLGEVVDTVMAAARDWDINQLRWFRNANRAPLNEFWGRAQTDALSLKQFLEKLEASLLAKEMK